MDHAGSHMSFWEHLEELRWTIVRSLVAVTVCTLLGWIFSDALFDLLLAPLNQLLLEADVQLIYSSLLDGFMIKLQLSLLAGIVLSLPLVGWFVWCFVRPGLTAAEQRMGHWTVTAGTVFFCLGAGFAYRMLSFIVAFLHSFGHAGVDHIWHLRIYLAFAFRLMLAFGILFELPVVIVLLVTLNLVKVDTLRMGRPYAIVVAFLLAAILTPPDIMSQLLLAFPLVMLYELGILAGAWQERRMRAQDALDAVEAHHDPDEPAPPETPKTIPPPSAHDIDDLPDGSQHEWADDAWPHASKTCLKELPPLFDDRSLFDKEAATPSTNASEGDRPCRPH